MSACLALLLSNLAWADYPQVDTSLGNDAQGLEGAPLGVGAGFVLGVPTGLSASWRPGDAFAVQASLAWHGQEKRVSTSMDLIINFYEIESDDVEEGRFVAYAGPGFVVRWGWVRNVQLSDWGVDKPMLGFRIPAGVVYLPEDKRVDVFLEVAPTLYVVPSNDLDLAAVLGARVYFGGLDIHL